MIEANPRASRTVPFVSKATGLPLAKLACRVMLGERLADLDLPARARAATTSRSRRRCCRSTASPAPTRCSAPRCARPARSWAWRPTSRPRSPRRRPRPARGCRGRHGVPHRHRLRQGRRSAAIAAQLHDLGFTIVATGGTAAAIARMGIPVERLNKIGEGSPHVVDWIERGDVVARHQHADGHRGARGRLRDPPRRDRPRHPVHHDDVRRDGRGARDRRRAPRGRPPVRLAAGDPPRQRGRARGARPRRSRRSAAAGCAWPAAARVGAYVVLSVADPDGPAPDPGQFSMLAAAERWGGGEDERPFLPRAFSVAAPPRRRHAGLPARGRRARGRRGSCELRAGDDVWLLGPLGPRLRAAARRAPAAARRRRRRHRAAGDLAGRARHGATVLLGFRDAAHAEGAALLRGAARRHRRRLGRPPRARSPSCSRASSARRRVEVYACGPPPMLEAVRALCAEHGVPAQLALESGMACGFGACFGCVVPTTRRLRPPVRRRAGARRGRRWSSWRDPTSAASSSRTRSSTPRGPSTRSPPGARSATRCSTGFPFAAFVSKTVTRRAARGQPAAAAVGAAARG